MGRNSGGGGRAGRGAEIVGGVPAIRSVGIQNWSMEQVGRGLASVIAHPTVGGHDRRAAITTFAYSSLGKTRQEATDMIQAAVTNLESRQTRTTRNFRPAIQVGNEMLRLLRSDRPTEEVSRMLFDMR